MGKQRKKPTVPETARRRGHQLPARVDDDMWAFLQARAKQDRRSVAQTVILLLEQARHALERQDSNRKP